MHNSFVIHLDDTLRQCEQTLKGSEFHNSWADLYST